MKGRLTPLDTLQIAFLSFTKDYFRGCALGDFHLRGRVACCAFGLSILMAAAASAQEGPDLDRIAEIVAESVPSWWSVGNIEIVATSDIGDAVNPRRAVRFEALARNSAPLFAETGQQGPFSIVVPTVAETQDRTLYGVVLADYRAGLWAGSATIENPVGDLGQPRDQFTRPTLVAGSPEGIETLEAMASTEVAGLTAGHRQRLSALEEEHARQISDLRAAQMQAVRDLEVEAAAAVAAVDGERQQALIAREAEYRAELARLTDGLAPTIAEAREAYQAALAEEQETHAHEMDELRANHAAARGALIESQRQEMAEVETQLATELRSLQTQLDTSEEVIALQQELIARLAERQAGAEELLAAFEAARAQRRDFFSRLPTDWRGQVDCRAEDAAVAPYTATITGLEITEVTAEGFSGSFASDSRSFWGDFSMVMAEEGIALPMPMRLSLAIGGGARNFPNRVEMTVTQDGRMFGSAPQQWSVDNRTIEGACQFQIAS